MNNLYLEELFHRDLAPGRVHRRAALAERVLEVQQRVAAWRLLVPRVVVTANTCDVRC